MMRLIFLFSFLLLVAGCSKNKLNKPCTINFTSDFVGSNGAGSEKFSGSFTTSRLNFSGSRKEGGDVDIEKELNNQKFDLAQSTPLGLNIDVPVGVYSHFQVKVRLSQNNSLELKKSIEPQIQMPVIVQFSQDLDIVFEQTSETMELKKKENYTCVLMWNFFKLFNGINNPDWNNATTTTVDGVETVLINENTNTAIFAKVKSNLTGCVSAKIE